MCLMTHFARLAFSIYFRNFEMGKYCVGKFVVNISKSQAPQIILSTNLFSNLDAKMRQRALKFCADEITTNVCQFFSLNVRSPVIFLVY